MAVHNSKDKVDMDIVMDVIRVVRFVKTYSICLVEHGVPRK